MGLLPTAPFDPERRVAFMHIPKAAGTSLTVAMANRLGLPRSKFHFDWHHFGRLERLDLIQPDCRASVCSDPSELLAEEGFVAGHISLSTLLVGRPASQLLTVLREPVCRILSHWLFCRAVTDAQLEPWGPEWAAIVHQSRGSLMDFLAKKTGAPQSDNLTLRMLLRPHPLIPDADFIEERHDDVLLDEALDRLERFSVVDVIENPNFEINLSTWFGAPVALPYLNEAPEIPPTLRRDLLADLPDSTFARLKHRSRLDLEVWTNVFRRLAPDTDLTAIRQRTISHNIARFSRLLGGARSNTVTALDALGAELKV